MGAHQAPPSLGFSRQEPGVGCHFLLQCMKVKSESEVAQSCPTRSDPMDCSPPGSSVHGIFQARVLEWGAIAFSDLGAKYAYCFHIFSANKVRKYTRVNQPMYIKMSINMPTCNHLFPYQAKTWVSKDVFSSITTWIFIAFTPCLSVASHSTVRETWLPPSAIHLLNCLISICMYSGFRIFTPYSHGKQLYQLEDRAYTWWFSSLLWETPLISKVT